ncbi:hypothetical protein ES707_12249 [subsurface metagenome]
MAKKVSLINMKGGVGKSTLAVNLAWQFAGMTDWSKKVLVIDLDPQFNATQYLIGQTKVREIFDEGRPTIWDIFEQLTRTPGSKELKPLAPASVIHNVVTFRSGSRIDLIPSRLELAYSLMSPSQKEELLAKFVAKIENEYNLVVLDCAPTESFLTMAAYLTSDYILVPVKPEYLSSIGLPLLVRSMDEFHAHHEDHELKLAGIVFNSATQYVPEEAISKAEVRSIAKEHGWYVFKEEISYSRSYPKGAREGRPIFRTSYSRWDQAHKFHNFAKEFADRIGL